MFLKWKDEKNGIVMRELIKTKRIMMLLLPNMIKIMKLQQKDLFVCSKARVIKLSNDLKLLPPSL